MNTYEVVAYWKRQRRINIINKNKNDEIFPTLISQSYIPIYIFVNKLHKPAYCHMCLASLATKHYLRTRELAKVRTRGSEKRSPLLSKFACRFLITCKFSYAALIIMYRVNAMGRLIWNYYEKFTNASRCGKSKATTTTTVVTEYTNPVIRAELENTAPRETGRFTSLK